MLEEGPPDIVFRARLRDAIDCLRCTEGDVILDTLREQNLIASAAFNLPRHGRFLDRVRERLGSQFGRAYRDKDLAAALGISRAAMSNFRKAKETSSRVRGLFESMFHWCYEPELHPRYVWLYTKLLTIEALYEPVVNFGLFLQCDYLSRVYDDWHKIVRARGVLATRSLANEVSRQAADDLRQLARYRGHFESRHLRDAGLKREWSSDFLRVGPWCLAVDTRIHQLICEGGTDAA